MFPPNLDAFKAYQKELQQRAAHYRLVKSLKQPYCEENKLYAAIGRVLINTGQNLVKRTQAAH